MKWFDARRSAYSSVIHYVSGSPDCTTQLTSVQILYGTGMSGAPKDAEMMRAVCVTKKGAIGNFASCLEMCTVPIPAVNSDGATERSFEQSVSRVKYLQPLIAPLYVSHQS